MTDFQEILNFWFEELSPNQHWAKDLALDELISHRFLELHGKARSCELFSWRNSAGGRLAEIIILDQFSRNIFRNQAESFASDSLALVLAQEFVSSGQIKELPPTQRSFAIMPYMHSESLMVHNEAMILFADPEFGGSLDFERRHRDIIARFGRYPHRNQILGRDSTPEEIEFLKLPGSGF